MKRGLDEGVERLRGSDGKGGLCLSRNGGLDDWEAVLED